MDIDKINYMVGELGESVVNEARKHGRSPAEFLRNSFQVPPYLRDTLEPVRGVCTYKLLDGIRFGGYNRIEWDGGRVEGAIGEWFQQLRGTTSEWSYRPQDPDRVRCENLAREGMLSHQWGCMGEELLALDNATRVPRDAPEIQRIYKAVRSIPEWIRSQIIQQFDGVEIEILPIGSFPNDVKVLDVDEFDFLLISNASKDRLPEIQDFIHGKLRQMLPLPDVYRIYKRLYIYDSDFGDFTRELHVKAVYPHGPALCTVLSWVCSHAHEHNISVDITIARRDPRTKLKQKCSGIYEGGMFQELHRMMDDGEEAVRLEDGMFTSCTADSRAMATVARISPQVLPVYRLVKVLTSAAVPGCVRLVDSPDWVEFSGLVSSHNLKQYLYRTVALHPRGRHWSLSQLPHRVIDILSHIKLGEPDLDYVSKRGDMTNLINRLIPDKNGVVLDGRLANLDERKFDEKTRHLVTIMKMLDPSCRVLPLQFEVFQNDYIHLQLEKRLDRVRMAKKLGNQRNCVTSLINLIKQRHDHYYIDNTVTTDTTAASHSNIHILFMHDNKLYPCTNDPIMLAGLSEYLSDNLVYRLPKPNMLFSSHPLLQEIERHKLAEYKKYPGADMSKIHPQQFNVAAYLIKVGDLTLTDLQDERLLHVKVSRFYTTDLGCGHIGTLMMCHKGADIIDIVCLVQEEYPELYCSPLSDVLLCLTRLAPMERVVVRKLCHLAAEHVDTTRAYNKDLYTDMSEAMQHMMQVLSEIWLLLERFRRDESKSRQPICVAGFYIAQDFLYKGTNTEYFRCIKEKHHTAAEALVERILSREIAGYIESGGRRWRIVRMTPGGDSFLKSVLTHGWKYLLQTERIPSGIFLHGNDEIIERAKLWFVRSEVVRFCGKHAGFISRIFSQHRPGVDHWSVDPTDLLLMAAVAFLAKTQVHVYRRHEGGLVRVLRVPRQFYRGRYPVSVLMEGRGSVLMEGWAQGFVQNADADRYNLLVDTESHPLGNIWENADNQPRSEGGTQPGTDGESDPRGPDDFWPRNGPLFGDYASTASPGDSRVKFTSVLEEGIRAARDRTIPVDGSILYVIDDADSLYRCLAAHLFTDLRGALRSNGIISNQEMYLLEKKWAATFRKAVIDICQDNRESLEKASSSLRFLLDKTNGMRYRDLSSRLEVMASEPGGHLELAAMSFLTKTRIQVYTRNQCRVVPSVTLGSGKYKTNPPIKLLHTPPQKNIPGHFHLIVAEESKPDLWDIKDFESDFHKVLKKMVSEEEAIIDITEII